MGIRHKYKAVQCEDDGIKFPSKAERNYYRTLKMLQKAGDVVFFLRQPSFDLPGGVKYRADFLEFWADGTVHVTDVKGVQTESFKAKKRMVESLYPVEIEIR